MKGHQTTPVTMDDVQANRQYTMILSKNVDHTRTTSNDSCEANRKKVE